MSRVAHLQALYLKMVYAMEEERKQSQPSECVLEACQIAKRAIYREYNQLAQQRGAHP